MMILLVLGAVSAQAGGWHHHWGHGHWGHGSRVSFNFGGGYPYYAPVYSFSYPVYSYPAYDYGYSYSRPNYAVGGTLLGALAGGLIGHGIHHQGWEGAGIGAAAGLLLGGIAEHNARARERVVYSAPVVASAPQAYVAPAPTVNDAPVAPAAPVVPAAPTRPATTMSGANGLFGR